MGGLGTPAGSAVGHRGSNAATGRRAALRATKALSLIDFSHSLQGISAIV